MHTEYQNNLLNFNKISEFYKTNSSSRIKTGGGQNNNLNFPRILQKRLNYEVTM